MLMMRSIIEKAEQLKHMISLEVYTMRKTIRKILSFALTIVILAQLSGMVFAFSGSYTWSSGGSSYTACVDSQFYTTTAWVLSGTNVYHNQGSITTITVSGSKSSPIYTASIPSSSYTAAIKSAINNTNQIKYTYSFYRVFDPAIYLTIPSSNPNGTYNAAVQVRRYTCSYVVRKSTGDSTTIMETGTITNAPSLTEYAPYIHEA